jgi:regulator of cell morphogenesis and NO signaling
MSAFSIQDTVGEVVAKSPALLRLFESARIDYCCGGKKTLAEVCQERSLDPQAFLATLDEAVASSGAGANVDVAGMSLTDLANHIEKTHHAFLREEFPRLHMLTSRVAQVHGGDDPRLVEVRDTCLALAGEMANHMMKEEKVLFPMIRQLDASTEAPSFHCGSLANPIRQMELEHHGAGDALERLRTLTDEYSAPTWACNTYRAMLDALANLERDMHLHVHKEDNVLYPRALKREAELSKGVPV